MLYFVSDAMELFFGPLFCSFQTSVQSQKFAEVFRISGLTKITVGICGWEVGRGDNFLWKREGLILEIRDCPSRLPNL